LAKLDDAQERQVPGAVGEGHIAIDDTSCGVVFLGGRDAATGTEEARARFASKVPDDDGGPLTPAFSGS
jgi:hypothetical protein